MSEEVVIFGTSGFSRLALWYLKNDSNFNVCGFAVDDTYFEEESHEGLPVVPWSQIHRRFKPSQFRLFAPMSPTNMNRDREQVWLRAKDEGYSFISYISSRATVLTEEIGENCFILENNTLQPFSRIGSNTILWSGNHIGHDTTIEDSVFVASHVVISGRCRIGKYSYLGVNSAVRDGLRLSEGTFLGMSSALTKEVLEPWGTYIGVPAKRAVVASYDQRL
jgi:sugar O-acyltransferase (sialic acid O-acetyltransferase NeuD family)